MSRLQKDIEKISGSIRKIDNPASIEEDWRTLESHCDVSFFLSWAWIGSWINMVFTETDLYLFSARRSNTIVGLGILTISDAKRMKGLIKTRQISLNEYLADGFDMIIQYNDLLAKSSDQILAWHCMFNTLKNSDLQWDEFNLSSLNKDSKDAAIKASKYANYEIDKEHYCWRVNLRDSYDNADHLISQFKRKSRQQLRQSLKAYTKQVGKITYTVAGNADQALTYFDYMNHMHTERWNMVGKKGSFANRKWVEFHRSIITEGFPFGLILLMEIRSGSSILGYLYGHIYKGIAYMQQTGFAVSHDNKLRPGYISHIQGMLYCAGIKLKYYDFLPDDGNSYKKFFTAATDLVFWLRIQKPLMKFKLENTIRKLRAWIS